MSILVCDLQGRFGNQSLIWLFARAYAEKHGFDFQCESWIGERVFAIESTRPHNYDAFPRYNEDQLMRHGPPDHSFVFRGYGQTTWCATHYTKRMAQAWLPLRAELDAACRAHRPTADRIICHLRRGDYAPYGYVVCSSASYYAAMGDFGLDPSRSDFLSEEAQGTYADIPTDLAFVADFYRMMHAPTLLRANSSFSFLAALLGNGLVLSPVIDGLEGGKEHDVRFVAGNHPRFANLDFVQAMHVAP
jgi:hypothetical protein